MSFLTIAWLGGSLFGYMFRSTGDRFCTWTLRFETWGSHSNVGEAVEVICLLASFLVWKKLKEKKRYQQVCLHQNSEDLPSQLQGTSKYSFVPKNDQKGVQNPTFLSKPHHFFGGYVYLYIQYQPCWQEPHTWYPGILLPNFGSFSNIPVVAMLPPWCQWEVTITVYQHLPTGAV